ncbi:MAG TPA: ComEC/Rec2 family competence protein [Solirubrobacterales bacterium]|nr:ComEC/Rec2 family competence protein [Solirubrobacterales bacterium]
MRSPRPSLPVLVGIAVLVAVAIARTAEIRERALAGLGEGMPTREAALARGFVLGEDDGLDAGTKEDFVRAGLSHLTAVSGENVTLLALVAMPILAAFGIPLRERLVWAIGLIAVYVPLAGSAPSIQRAGVMGVAGLLATLTGRRTSRLYALALALAVTLAIDPSVAGDVGWQLSFAAVLGILLLAAPIREWLLARFGPGAWRRALAEGIAVTVAATLATAPLIAFVFEEVSLTSLAANVLALPAVAPAMWLGMVSAALAQIPGIPLAPLNGLDALLLAYIAQVAAWCGRPSWAVLHLHIDLATMLGTYAAMAAAIALGADLARARRLAAARAGAPTARLPLRGVSTVGRGRVRQRGRRLAVFVVVVAVALVAALAARHRHGAAPGPAPGLRIEVLDVGQGDAILLRPRNAPAVLVDGGPSGDELVAKLHDEGVARLGAALVTHDQSDHVAGIAEALGHLPISRLVFGRLDRDLLATARADGARPERVAAGTTLRSGSLCLEVLWPPPTLLAEDPPGTDPNSLALVIRARWHRFTMLLTADAEAESTPLDPGPIDVLKVAHHGSDDAGLGPLLDRIRPRLAVISVGADNPYGHPTPGTLATLADHGVPTLRTDLDGTIEIDVRRRSFSVHSDD